MPAAHLQQQQGNALALMLQRQNLEQSMQAAAERNAATSARSCATSAAKACTSLAWGTPRLPSAVATRCSTRLPSRSHWFAAWVDTSSTFCPTSAIWRAGSTGWRPEAAVGREPLFKNDMFRSWAECPLPTAFVMVTQSRVRT